MEHSSRGSGNEAQTGQDRDVQLLLDMGQITGEPAKIRRNGHPPAPQ